MNCSVGVGADIQSVLSTDRIVPVKNMNYFDLAVSQCPQRTEAIDKSILTISPANHQ